MPNTNVSCSIASWRSQLLAAGLIAAPAQAFILSDIDLNGTNEALRQMLLYGTADAFITVNTLLAQ